MSFKIQFDFHPLEDKKNAIHKHVTVDIKTFASTHPVDFKVIHGVNRGLVPPRFFFFDNHRQRGKKPTMRRGQRGRGGQRNQRMGLTGDFGASKTPTKMWSTIVSQDQIWAESAHTRNNYFSPPVPAIGQRAQGGGVFRRHSDIVFPTLGNKQLYIRKYKIVTKLRLHVSDTFFLWGHKPKFLKRNIIGHRLWFRTPLKSTQRVLRGYIKGKSARLVWG